MLHPYSGIVLRGVLLLKQYRVSVLRCRPAAPSRLDPVPRAVNAISNVCYSTASRINAIAAFMLLALFASIGQLAYVLCVKYGCRTKAVRLTIVNIGGIVTSAFVCMRGWSQFRDLLLWCSLGAGCSLPGVCLWLSILLVSSDMIEQHGTQFALNLKAAGLIALLGNCCCWYAMDQADGLSKGVHSLPLLGWLLQP